MIGPRQVLEVVSEAFDALRTGLAVFDSDDVVVYHNRHLLHIYLAFDGMPSLLGRTYESILRTLLENGEIAGREVIDDPEGWLRRRVEQHRRQRVVVEEQRIDGRWIQEKSRSIPSGGTVGQWSDITERKRHELLLVDAVECSADGFSIWDQRDRLVLFNSKFAERLGGNDVRTGDTFCELVTQISQSGVKMSMTGGEDSDCESEMPRRRRQHQCHYYLDLPDDSSLVVRERRSRDGGRVMTLTDVTELKRKERELIYRGQSLEQALGEIEMAKQVLEDQAAQLVGLAEEGDYQRRIADEERRRADILRIEAEAVSQRIGAILRTTGDGLIVANARGEIEQANEAAARVFGYAHSEMIGASIKMLMPDDVAAEHDQYLRRYNSTHESRILGRVVERLGRRRNGALFPIEITVTAVETAFSPYFVASFRDITARKAAEIALRENERKLRDLAANVPGVIFQWLDSGPGGRGYTYVSPRCLDFFGVEPSALIANPTLLAAVDPDHQAYVDSIRKAAEDNAEWSFEGLFLTPAAGPKWLRAMGRPTRVGGSIVYDGIFIDITEQKKLEQELVRLATVDPLTGARNRRAFMESLETCHQVARRRLSPVSVLICDIDFFKRINDTHGHAVGDEALKAFVQTVKSALRGTDTLGRVGGEEFAVVLPDTSLSAAVETAERLRLAVAAIAIPIPQGLLRFTVSIGVAAMDVMLNDPAAALKDADVALYKAKESGRDRVVAG